MCYTQILFIRKKTLHAHSCRYRAKKNRGKRTKELYCTASQQSGGGIERGGSRKWAGRGGGIGIFPAGGGEHFLLQEGERVL